MRLSCLQEHRESASLIDLESGRFKTEEVELEQ